MKADKVPQDDSPTYSGHKKLMYAVKRDGHYQGVQSSGWEVESYATQMAVEDLSQQAIDAFNDAQQNKCSTLAYYMFKNRLDITALAQASGFFQWQIRRHLKPGGLAKLSAKKQQKYCDVFAISREQLNQLPEQP